MHDDQHGTANFICRFIKCTRIREKKKECENNSFWCRFCSFSCANLYVQLGVSAANIIMFDKDGVLSNDRTDLSLIQKRYAIETKGLTLAEAIKGADVFLGLSEMFFLLICCWQWQIILSFLQWQLK
jgi:malate dehydrogenase (oxaloacetate-decarboxylating)(NADP+)